MRNSDVEQWRRWVLVRRGEGVVGASEHFNLFSKLLEWKAEIFPRISCSFYYEEVRKAVIKEATKKYFPTEMVDYVDCIVRSQPPWSAHNELIIVSDSLPRLRRHKCLRCACDNSLQPHPSNECKRTLGDRKRSKCELSNWIQLGWIACTVAHGGLNRTHNSR